VIFRPALFVPTFHKHIGESCGGCQIHVTDREAFRAVETGVAIVEAFRSADPSAFEWRQPPYEYEFDKPPIDILYGSTALRDGLAHGRSTASLAAGWTTDVAPFLELRPQCLLYS
jgi:uncharacterized protein YbbC (DUF1343 family)